MKTKFGKLSIAAAAAALVVVTLPSGAEAFSGTYNGNKQCNLPFVPRLTLTTTGNGNGTWVNNNNANSQNFTWNGPTFKFSIYQNVHWYANSSSWTTAPTATCAS